MITIKLFARLREQVGLSSLDYELTEPMSVAALLKELQQSDNSAWQKLESNEILFAINRVQVNPDAELKNGDELALFPPVTGG